MQVIAIYLKKTFANSVVVFFILAICWLATAHNYKKVYINRYKPENSQNVLYQNPPWEIPPTEWVNILQGFRFFFSDLFWFSIQRDIKYCDVYIRENRCAERSWIFRATQLVLSFDPLFENVYLEAPVFLTFLHSDLSGALSLTKDGIRKFPQNWNLQLMAAYLYYFEFLNPIASVPFFLEAQRLGGPPWLVLVASRISSENKVSVSLEKAENQTNRESLPLNDALRNIILEAVEDSARGIPQDIRDEVRKRLQ